MARVYVCHSQHNRLLRSSNVHQRRHLSITPPWCLPLACASGCWPDLAKVGQRGHVVKALRGYIFERFEPFENMTMLMGAGCQPQQRERLLRSSKLRQRRHLRLTYRLRFVCMELRRPTPPSFPMYRPYTERE